MTTSCPQRARLREVASVQTIWVALVALIVMMLVIAGYKQLTGKAVAI